LYKLNIKRQAPVTITTRRTVPMNLKRDGAAALGVFCLCKCDNRLLKLSLLTYISSFMLCTYSESISANDDLKNIKSDGNTTEL
jgi:hypothetical protein